MTCGQKKSYNNSGIRAKEQEEQPVCCLRYPPFLLFVQERSHGPAARKRSRVCPQNEQIMLFLKASTGRLAHTPPVKWQLTAVYSRHASMCLLPAVEAGMRLERDPAF